MLNIIKKSRILTSHIPDSQFPYPSSHKTGVSQPNWKQGIEVCSFSASTSTEIILPHKVRTAFLIKGKLKLSFSWILDQKKKKKSLFPFFVHSFRQHECTSKPNGTDSCLCNRANQVLAEAAGVMSYQEVHFYCTYK